LESVKPITIFDTTEDKHFAGKIQTHSNIVGARLFLKTMIDVLTKRDLKIPT
jgi:hypothetical protein